MHELAVTCSCLQQFLRRIQLVLMELRAAFSLSEFAWPYLNGRRQMAEHVHFYHPLRRRGESYVPFLFLAYSWLYIV